MYGMFPFPSQASNVATALFVDSTRQVSSTPATFSQLPADATPPCLALQDSSVVIAMPPTPSQATVSAHTATWVAWTSALMVGRGTQGALTTLAGRSVQFGMSVLFPPVDHPELVNDSVLRVLAATRLTLSAIQGVGAAYYAYRAAGQWDACTHGLQGHATSHVPTLANASTPWETYRRLCIAGSAGLAMFGATGYTGVNALLHVGRDFEGKEQAYNALVQSLGVSTYTITRETLNAALDDSLRPIVHHGALSLVGAACTGLFAMGLGEAGAAYLNSGDASPAGWLGISAALEAADAAAVALALRCHQPDRHVSLLQGRFNESAHPAHPADHGPSNWQAFVYRIGLRSTLRNLLGELTSVSLTLEPEAVSSTSLPTALAQVDIHSVHRYVWSIGNLITHVRELVIQADREAAKAMHSVHSSLLGESATEAQLLELAHATLNRASPAVSPEVITPGTAPTPPMEATLAGSTSSIQALDQIS